MTGVGAVEVVPRSMLNLAVAVAVEAAEAQNLHTHGMKIDLMNENSYLQAQQCSEDKKGTA